MYTLRFVDSDMELQPPENDPLDAGTITATPGDGTVAIAQGTAPSGGSESYTRDLYRSTDGSKGSLLAGSVTLPYDDDTAVNDTEYTYTLEVDDGITTDDTPSVSATPEEATNFDANWQLGAGHYFDAEAADEELALYVVYPRPNAETNTYARHRWAYPGIKYEIPIGVQFGAWPYRYQLITGPSWLDIEYETLMPSGDVKERLAGYGVLSGTAPATPQTAENIVVRVTDQTDATVDVEFSVEVSATPFIFLDPVNGNNETADGTIDLPYAGMDAMQASEPGQVICYIRETPGYLLDREMRVGSSNNIYPHSYIGYPGETVVIDCSQRAGLSQNSGSSGDVFIGDLTALDTNQTSQSTADVRVIRRLSQMMRETLFRVTIENPFMGTSGSDNFGAVMYMALSGSTDDPTPGHWHLYMTECVGDALNPADGGSNGASMWQAYMGRHCLLEHTVVKNSNITNNTLLGPKESEKHIEVRNCNAVENNSGNYQFRTLCSSERGFPKWLLFRHNFSGAAMGGIIGSAATEENRDSVDHGPIIHARNNYGSAGLSALPAVTPPYDGDYRAHDNAAGALNGNYPTASGNVIDSVGNLFDADMKLTGAARTTNLGLAGAEVA
jgi:hypothetical protein